MSSCEKEDLQKIHGKRFSRLDPHIKEHTTLSRLQSLDLEVSEMKTSLLDLHDKVSTLTFMLDIFTKDMKGMVVEDVVVEEDVDKGVAAKPQEDTVMEEEKEKEGEKEKEVADEVKAYEKEEEVIPEAVDATPIQTIPPTKPNLPRKGRLGPGSNFSC